MNRAPRFGQCTESVAPSIAEQLLSLGQELQRYSNDAGVAVCCMLEDGGADVPDELLADVAMRFQCAPDVLKLRAMVEEWELPRIADTVLFERAR